MRCRWVFRRGAAVVLWLSSPACSSNDAFQCAQQSDCDTGQCEPTGFCSFPDPGCPSGSRYGKLAGALSNQCVPLDTSSGTTASGTSGATQTSDPSATDTTAPTDPSDPTLPTGPSTDPTVDPSTDPTVDPTVDPTGGSTTTNGESDSAETSAGEGGTDSAGTDPTEGTDTGQQWECTAANFGTLPDAPLWFTFGSGGGSASVAGNKLILDVPGANGGSLAGLRSQDTGDYSTSRVTATFDSVPAATVVTTNVTLGSSTGAQSYAVVFRDDEVQVQLFENPDFTVLGSADTATLGWPITIEVLTDAGQVTATAIGASQTETLAQSAAPAWFDDVHASINAGNPMLVDPMGTIVADHFEICPPL